MAAPLDSPGARDFEDSEPLSEGFTVRLPTAQLADLIQINCVNRVQGVFRVCSGVERGHLFFSGGQLVHADFEGAVGLDAVVMMLGLRGGSIEPCERPWPATSTIDMGADALLLSAAQRLDESGERRSDPGRELTTKVVRIAPEDRPRESREDRRFSWPPAERLQRLEVAQVGLDGSIQKLKAGAAPDLADTAFHCQKVAGLIGEALSLGACQALAFESEQEQIVIFRGRSIVGVRGNPADLEFVRAKVGLA
jgi:hypothetical protein